MNIEWMRRHCLSFPHATESVQWTSHLVFKVGGKMYTVVNLEPGGNACSFKCAPEMFAELIERPGIIPAPYLARAYWVALETPEALPKVEAKRLLRQAYDLVFAKLPARTRAELSR